MERVGAGNLKIKLMLAPVWLADHQVQKARDQAMFILGKQAGNDKAVVLLSDTAIVRVEVEDIRNRR